MPRGRRNAYTLVELMVVAILLGLLAAAVLPLATNATPQRVEAVAEEVAGALRYARSLSLRTGQPHGVKVDPFSGRVTVFEADLSSGFVGVGPLVPHPQSGLPFAFDVDAVPGARGVALLNVVGPFSFSGVLFPRSEVVFEQEGFPLYWESGSPHPLVDGQVWVGVDGHVRTVRLAPSGRVTVE